MPTYTAPVRETRFILEQRARHRPLFQPAGLRQRHARPDRGDPRGSGQASARRCSSRSTAIGDEVGCKRNDDGSVTTPPGFKEAYKQFCEAGWPTLTAPEEYGGQGLPQVVGTAVSEYILSANHSFEMYQGLTSGAIASLLVKGSRRAEAELRAEHGHRQMDRHDEPHRAALRHRPWPAEDPRRSQRRRQLFDHRHQDLHLVGRARPQPRTSSTWSSPRSPARPTM